MLPLLSLHALAMQYGGGLRPELLALLMRQEENSQSLCASLLTREGGKRAYRFDDAATSSRRLY